MLTLRPQIGYNRWIIFALKIVSAMGFYFPIWYLYEQQYLTLTQIALLEGFMVGMQLLLEIPTGAIADLFGYKISILLGYVIQALAILWYAFARSFPAFLLFGLIIGLAESLKSGAEEAMEYDSLKAVGKERQYPKYKSWYTLAFQISLALTFIIGGIIGKTNMTLTIYMTVIASIVGAVLVALLVEPPLVRVKPNFARYLHQMSVGWHELTQNQHVINISMLYISVGIISWTTNISLMNMYMNQIGFHPEELGAVLGIIRILNILIIMKFLKQLISPEMTSKVYYFFMFLFAIGYLPSAILAKWPSVIILSLIMISTTARWVILGSYLHREIRSENRATALSTASMSISIGHMLIMLASASLLPILGGPKVLISVLGLLGLVSCYLLYQSFMRPPRLAVAAKPITR